jgi:hypothetical protein
VRYEIGQKVWTLGLTLVDKENKVATSSYFLRPLPELFDITNIFFNELTVVEHHRVPGEWTRGEKEYDGFILKDCKNIVWHNQYPKAKYISGEDSDSIFVTPLMCHIIGQGISNKIHLSDEEWKQKFIDHYNIVPVQQDLIHFMNDWSGGLLDSLNNVNKADDPLWHLKMEIQNKILSEFYKQTGKSLEPYTHSLPKCPNVKIRSWSITEGNTMKVFAPKNLKPAKSHLSFEEVLNRLNDAFDKLVENGWYTQWHKDRIYTTFLRADDEAIYEGILVYRKELEQKFLTAGWAKATISTSEEDGERSGAVGINLTKSS